MGGGCAGGLDHGNEGRRGGRTLSQRGCGLGPDAMSHASQTRRGKGGLTLRRRVASLLRLASGDLQDAQQLSKTGSRNAAGLMRAAIERMIAAVLASKRGETAAGREAASAVIDPRHPLKPRLQALEAVLPVREPLRRDGSLAPPSEDALSPPAAAAGWGRAAPALCRLWRGSGRRGTRGRSRKPRHRLYQPSRRRVRRPCGLLPQSRHPLPKAREGGAEPRHRRHPLLRRRAVYRCQRHLRFWPA